MNRVLSSRWMFWLVAVPSVIVFTVLTILGSRILINPTGIEVTPCGDVVMQRNYPMVDLLGMNFPLVRYVTTVTPLTPETNDGYVCREDNGRGTRYNHDHGRGFGRWKINHYANPCMQDPIGWVMHIVYTAYLFDAIPLRPISATATVISANDGRWALCPFNRPVL